MGKNPLLARVFFGFVRPKIDALLIERTKSIEGISL